jgi:diguanylate cyclase (GGDEF)-like protein/PAS domain S-box-containing protein
VDGARTCRPHPRNGYANIHHRRTIGQDGFMRAHQDVGTTDDADGTFTDLVGDTPAAVTIILDGRFVYANAASERLLGRRAGELLDEPVIDFVHADDRAPVRRRLLLADRSDPATIAGSFETDLIASGGAALRVESLVHSVTWGGKRAVGVISCDITARQAREEEHAHAATHDPLTGLANRALLLDRLEMSMARIGRSCDAVLVMLLDLNGFKTVNDTHGHSAGDKILRDVANRLDQAMRGSDTVARLSGDEFVICADLTDDHPGEAVVRGRIEAVMNTGYQLGDVSIPLSAGIGSMVITQYQDPLVVLAEVDQQMYAQKRNDPSRRR